MSKEVTKKAKGKKIKDTVRGRKRSMLTNTQRYIPFSEIRNDTVILKNGGLRAVLKVEPLNFNLKSETEQQGIIAGYESFINTIVFPLQIIIRSTKVNIDPYLDHISEQAENQKNELLKGQTVAYRDFVQKIVDVADIMQKSFYVVVPLDDTPRKKKKSLFFQFTSWLQIDDSIGKVLSRNRAFNSQTVRLRERIDLVETGLHNIGLGTKRLETMELINLYYKIYNPDSSQVQKLPEQEVELNTEDTSL